VTKKFNFTEGQHGFGGIIGWIVSFDGGEVVSEVFQIIFESFTATNEVIHVITAIAEFLFVFEH